MPIYTGARRFTRGAQAQGSTNRAEANDRFTSGSNTNRTLVPFHITVTSRSRGNQIILPPPKNLGPGIEEKGEEKEEATFALPPFE